MPDVDEIPLRQLYKAQRLAQLRLQIWVTGKTHEMMLDFAAQARTILLQHASDSGTLDGLAGHKIQNELLSAWSKTLEAWIKILNLARREAVALPFSVVAIYYERLVRPTARKFSESAQALYEADYGGSVFNPQIRLLMDAASDKFYGDHLNLSGRIWRLDRDARDGINKVLMNGISSGDSAWNVAKQLEAFLGGGQDCPRWTSTRLYDLSKAGIANSNKTGLLTGDACDGRGMAYNALRLARTEIQSIHAMATDKQLAMSPWVEKEQVNLSPGHVGDDECNQAIQDGEDGKGIYPVGTISLPFHPNCMCYKTAMTMKDGDFVDKLRSWLADSNSWPEMSNFSNAIGGTNVSLKNDKTALALGIWLWGTAKEIGERMQ